MTVTFTNTASNNESIELQLSGNWIDRYCTITWKDQPVAQITRDFLNARQILGDADTVSFASASAPQKRKQNKETDYYTVLRDDCPGYGCRPHRISLRHVRRERRGEKGLITSGFSAFGVLDLLVRKMGLVFT
jgi:hypothetical protein